jgi:hypothetical protein
MTEYITLSAGGLVLPLAVTASVNLAIEDAAIAVGSSTLSLSGQDWFSDSFADSFEGTPPTGWNDLFFPFGNPPQQHITTNEAGTPPGGGSYAYRQSWITNPGSGSTGSLWLPFSEVPGMPATFGTGSEFRISYWQKYDANFDWGDTSGFKQFILYSTVPDDSMYLCIYGDRLGVLFQNTFPTQNWFYSNTNGDDYVIPKGEWVKFDWYVKVSPMSQKQGVLKGWVNDVLRWNYSGIATVNADSAQYNEISLNHTFNNTIYGANQKRYWDLFSIGPVPGFGISNVSADLTTITGNGFGTEGATNVTFDNFEDGTVNTAATVGTWESVNLLSVSNQARHSGSAYAAHYNYAGSGGIAGVTGKNNLLSRKWFIQYWVKLNSFDWGTGLYPSNSQYLSNIKFLRFWNPGGSAYDNFFTAFDWGLTDGAFSDNDTTDGQTLDYFTTFSKSSLSDGNWHCLQFEFVDSSAPRVADASFKFWHNGVLVHDRANFVADTEGLLKRPYHIGFYNAWELGSGETSRAPNDFYMDDVYSAPTLARVEIGNASTYDACTHREIQIPTTWSDSAITVSVNQGSFNAGDNVYLFVTNSEGEHSVGYGPIAVPGFGISNVSANLTTITGNGFGTHSLDIESIDSTIEGGTVSSDFAKTGWSNNWGWANHKYATDQKHSGSKSLKVTVGGSNYNGVLSYRLPQPVLAGEELFLSYWVRYSGSSAGQWKMLRVSGNETIVDGAQEIALFNWFALQQQLVVHPSTANDQTFWLDEPDRPAADATWYRKDVYISGSSTNTANGTIVETLIHPGSAISTFTASNVKTHVASGDDLEYIIWQNYLGNGNTGADIWTDDIYIQKGTRARVEIGDNVDFDSCTHREIQVPSAWSNSSITITPRRGSFNAGSSVYVFVVGDDGVASSGYGPVTVP